MNQFQHFIWLAGQVFECLVFFWQISLVLIVVVGVAGRYNFPFTPSRFERKHLLIFSPLLLSAAILLIGAHAKPRLSDAASQFSEVSILVLFYLHLPLGAFVVYQLKNFRRFALSVVLFEIWFGLFCEFLAGMSVTGRWL